MMKVHSHQSNNCFIFRSFMQHSDIFHLRCTSHPINMLSRVALLSVVFALSVMVISAKNYSGWLVLKITANTLQNEEANVKLDNLANHYFPEIIIYNQFTAKKNASLVLVSRPFFNQIHTALQEDFKILILDRNVQRLIEEEKVELKRRRHKRSISGIHIPDPESEYLSYDEVNSTSTNESRLFSHHHTSEQQGRRRKRLQINLVIDQLISNNKAFTEKITIGRSFEGRSITMLRINEKKEWRKPKFLIEAGLHAREWLSHSTAVNIAKELVTNPKYRYLRDHLDIYVLPVSNPDGYEYTRTADRYWRKNRRSFPDQCSRAVCADVTSCANCDGVDLNRNFPFKWNLAVATSDCPCSETYRGQAASSEPETLALTTWLHHNRPRGYLTMHAYGQFIAHPWGYARNMYTADNELMMKIERHAVNAIEQVNGNRFKYGATANVVYPVSGGSDDFAKSVGVKYVFMMELRPIIDPTVSNWEALFHPPVSEILPAAQETMAAVKVVANAIICDHLKQKYAFSSIQFNLLDVCEHIN